jgi:hypothetical protein
MAELVDDTRASGKRKFKPKRTGEVTPEPGSSSIPIDPVLLAESMTQEKLYSDTDSDSDVRSLSLALHLYQYSSRMMLPMPMIRVTTQTTTQKKAISVL